MPATEPETSILPDPVDAAGVAAVAPDRADDLIASLADRQIDDLMADAGESPPDVAADAAIDSAVNAAGDVTESAGALVASAAGDLKAELDQMEADRAGSIIDRATQGVEPPAVVAPSFDPSRATPAVEPPAATPHLEPQPTPSAAAAAPPEESSAEAVARELAEDVAMLSKPLPSVVEHDAQVAAADPWWKTAIAFVLSLPMLLLGAINLPVQPLSDRGREIIGAIGIVTLVNAAGLLVYLMLFARGH